MKTRLIKNDQKPTALHKLLEKVEGYEWSRKDEYPDLLAQIKREPSNFKRDTLTHAGDLKPGEVGEDEEGNHYIGFRSGAEGITGAYEFNGMLRWITGAGPQVTVHPIGEIVLHEEGATAEPDGDEILDEKGSEISQEEYDRLLEAARGLATAVKGRFDKGSAGKIDSALSTLQEVLGDD